MNLYVYDRECLCFRKVSIKQYIWSIIIILFIISSFSFSVIQYREKYIEEIPVVIKTEEKEFNEENLKEEIKRLNFKFPDIIYQQAIVEGASKTGKRWNNPIFLEGNNFLGLKRAYSRPSTAINWNEHNYCIYNNWRDCLLDMSLFQAQNCRKIHTEEEYYQFLQDLGYSINPNYNDLLKKVK